MQDKINILNVYDKNGISGVKEVVAGIKQLNIPNCRDYTLCLRNIEGTKDSPTDFFVSSSRKFSPMSFLVFQRIMRQKNISIIHSHQAKSLIYSVVYKKFFDKNIIIIQHEHGEILKNGRTYRFILRLSSRFVDLYLPVSKAVANLLVDEIGIDWHRVIVLYNFVDLQKFNRDSISWDIKIERAKLGITDKDFLVGFAGRLVEIKGWREFVEAAKMITKQEKNIKFIIAGDGEDKGKLVHMIRQYGIETSLKYMGRVVDMVKFYSILDCFVMPSHREGLPMVQLEVAAMGVPIVSARSVGSNEIFEDKKECLYFEARDALDLKEKILALVRDEAKGAFAAKNAVTTAKSYSLARYLEKVRVIYEQVRQHHQESIKICFISRSAYPLFDPKCNAVFGGAEVDLYAIASELAKDEKYNVSFLVGDFGQKRKRIISGVTVHKTYRYDESKLIQIMKLIRAMFHVRADIYFREAASGSVGITALFCKLFGLKFIYRTASEPECDGRFGSSHPIEGRLFYYGLRNATNLIVQSEVNRLQLKNTYGLDSSVIKNGTMIPPPSRTSPTKILWVARSDKLKQPHLFLDLAKSFPSEDFVMVCPKANAYSINVDELKKSAMQINNLTFFEKIPYAQMQAVFQESKIFVNTSTYEGFPNTFTQALANGNAILSLNVNPDRFLDKNNCGFCANGNISILKSKLGELLNDGEHLSSLQRNAYAYAKSNHDLQRIIISYKRLFEAAVLL